MILGLVFGILVVGAVWAGVALDQANRRQAGIDRLKATVAATADGAEVDLGTAFDLPWDRAVLMPAYSDAAAMNARLGFEGYRAGATSSQDEATQFLVFVKGTTVVADTNLFPGEDFKFAPDIDAFTREEARFIVTRDAEPQQVLLVRNVRLGAEP